MFTSIKTSRENKEVVTQLTRKLNLGAENMIARLALAYSLSLNRKLDLEEIKNSQGKEYSKNVLFGEFSDFYLAMVCVHYNLYKTHKDLPRYIKMHIDDGLELINSEVEGQPNLSGFDFLIDKIETGLSHLQ